MQYVCRLHNRIRIHIGGYGYSIRYSWYNTGISSYSILYSRCKQNQTVTPFFNNQLFKYLNQTL
jgi:hypothetical protein